jgi:hypothetical protein
VAPSILLNRRFTFFSVLILSIAPQSAFGSASFTQKSVGIGSGYTKFLGDLPSVSGVLTDWAIPLTLNVTFYIESGFEAYARIGALFLYQRTGLGSDGAGNGILIGFGGQVGIRKLLLEEDIRPYVGFHLTGFGAGKVAQEPAILPGIGATVGVDFFVAESVSIGAQATADMYVALVPLSARFSIGAGLVVSTYF